MYEAQQIGRLVGRRMISNSTLAWLHLRTNPAWLHQMARRWLDGSRMVMVIGSAHRVGSTWLFNLLRDLGCLRNAIHQVPPDLHRYGALWPGTIDYHWLANIHGWAILKGHANPPQTREEAALARFVTIHRDPRDVLVSASFQRARLSKEQGGWGATFAALPPAKRIEQLLLDPSPALLYELERWFRTPFAIHLTYEELYTRPVTALARLSAEIGLAVNNRQITAVVARHDFNHVTGRSPGQEANAAARKGIIGDWHNYFTSDLVACFNEAGNGRWRRLLDEMGYEW